VYAANGRVSRYDSFEKEGRHKSDVGDIVEEAIMRAKGQIRRIQLSFVAGGEDGDDARRGGAQEEREEVVEKAHARVVTKGHEGVKSFGCL
jgi:vacuolar-type H+-ATPase subunit H